MHLVFSIKILFLVGINLVSGIPILEQRATNGTGTNGTDCEPAGGGPKPGSTNGTCTSQQCVDVAKLMAGSMDKTVNPCDNFFQYACGNWAKAMNGTNAPKAKQAFDLQFMKSLDIFQKSLDSLSTTNATDPNVSRVASFYSQCMDPKSNNTAGVASLSKDFMNAKDVSSVLTTAMGLGVDGLFKMEVGPDIKVGDLNAVILSQPEPLLGTDEPGVVRLFEDFIKNTFTAAKIPPAPKIATDIITLDQQLFQMGQDIPSPEAAYNKLPLTQFPALQSMLSPMAGNTSTVIVDAPQYFQKLDQAIKSMDVELVKYYVMFKVLNNERLGPFLPEALVKPRNDFEDAVDKLPEPKGGPAPKGTRKRRVRKRNIYMPPQDPLSFAGEGEGEKRKVQCAQAVGTHLKYSSNINFMKGFFPTEAKPDLEKKVQLIRAAYEKSVNESDWIDPGTKSLISDKLEKIFLNMGFPSFQFDPQAIAAREGFDIGPSFLETGLNALKFDMKNKLGLIGKPLDKLDFSGISMFEANAYYDAQRNEYVFPAGIFQFPTYDLTFPAYLNMGNTGSTLGHEMAHALDNDGRQWNASGVLVEWWQPNAVKEFDSRANCFVQQYNNLTLFNTPINGTFTLAENLADNVGVNQAYRAWKDDRGANNQALPGFENFTAEQMFFMSYGLTFCGMVEEQSIKNQIERDEHAPGVVRVNGVVANNPAFAQAFQCSTGSAMNPSQKCFLW